jgi:hypothetical protein
MNYETSGFNETLVRVSPIATNEYDAASIEGLLSASSVSDRFIQSLSVGKLIAGTISVIANIGDEAVIIDGANRRIIVNDGTNDRVLIGYLLNGF